MNRVNCPKCGAELGYGYGYAYGNGIGGYEYCTKECGYYQKWSDEEPEDDKND